MTAWRWASPRSSNKVDGCWLDYNPEIFVSAIICQVLSTITSSSDIGARITHHRLVISIINYKSDRRLSWSSAKLLHWCQSPSSAPHFSQISHLTHFIWTFPRPDNISECHQSWGCSLEYQHSVIVWGNHWPPSDWPHVTPESSDWLVLVTWVWCQPTWSWSVLGPIHFISHNICSRHTQKLQGDIKILEFIVNSHHHILHWLWVFFSNIKTCFIFIPSKLGI